MIDDHKRGPGRPRTVTVTPAVVHVPAPVANVTVTAEPEKPKKFPVKVLRGYFPKDTEQPQHPIMGGALKIERGNIVELPLDEAKELIASGLAERADSLP